MSNFQVWIVFLLALSLSNSCALVHSYLTPISASHDPDCYHHTPPMHRHRKTPPPPLWLSPPPPAAFYFFSPPPPSPPYRPVGQHPKHMAPPRIRVLWFGITYPLGSSSSPDGKKWFLLYSRLLCLLLLFLFLKNM